MQATPMIDPAGKKRILLLVDDEENILSAMKRLLRREGYEILAATGGEAALSLLADHAVDVIVSDQRMPGMTGLEFLRRARSLYPDSIRMVLSGYTELDSITAAINEGAIYKFLTKPWNDNELRAHIADAFHQKELADENRRLAAALQAANQELAEANRRLQHLLAEREERISRDETALNVLHEALELLPWPLLGVDEQGLIVMMNSPAEALFGPRGALLATPLADVLPAGTAAALLADSGAESAVRLGDRPFLASARPLGVTSAGRGLAITLRPGAGS